MHKGEWLWQIQTYTEILPNGQAEIFISELSGLSEPENLLLLKNLWKRL